MTRTVALFLALFLFTVLSCSEGSAPVIMVPDVAGWPRTQSATVTVTRVGLGTVVSEPSGIECGARCSADFPTGTLVKLRAQPADPAYFAGWSGACVNAGECQITIDGPHRATARFNPKLCSEDHFCHEYPLPWNGDLNGISGSSERDVWVVGDRGAILHWNGEAWRLTPGAPGGIKGLTTDGQNVSLHGIWSSGPDRAWAVGEGPDQGTILAWNGGSWQTAVSGVVGSLYAVWGSGSDHVWAAGARGVLLKLDGVDWKPIPIPTTQDLFALWGSGPGDLWVVGSQGTILHWDGTRWSPLRSPVQGPLNAIWGSGPKDIWAGGDAGLIHWDGERWQALRSGLGRVQWLWGQGPGRVWAVGDIAMRWDGSFWGGFKLAGGARLKGIWGSGPDDIWAVGEAGAIAHFDGVAWSLRRRDPSIGGIAGIWGSGPSDIWLAAAIAEDGQAMPHWDGTRMNMVPFDPCRKLNAYWEIVSAWGNGPTDVWAVSYSWIRCDDGTGSSLLHWDGSRWDTVRNEEVQGLRRIWGNGQGEIWVIGEEAGLHHDGTRWRKVSPTPDLMEVWGSDPQNVWAVGGNGAIARWKDGNWSPIQSGTMETLYAVWGSGPNKVWAAGSGNTLLRWDGAAWKPVQSPLPAATGFRGLWGTAVDDVWASGGGGVLLHFDGKSWTEKDSGSGDDLSAIFGIDSQNIWLGTEGGAILRYRR